MKIHLLMSLITWNLQYSHHSLWHWHSYILIHFPKITPCLYIWFWWNLQLICSVVSVIPTTWSLPACYASKVCIASNLCVKKTKHGPTPIHVDLQSSSWYICVVIWVYKSHIIRFWHGINVCYDGRMGGMAWLHESDTSKWRDNSSEIGREEGWKEGREGEREGRRKGKNMTLIIYTYLYMIWPHRRRDNICSCQNVYSYCRCSWHPLGMIHHRVKCLHGCHPYIFCKKKLYILVYCT